MSHVAIIVGIAGGERYLDRERVETTELKRAKRFRSPVSAEQAARAHVDAFPPCIRRNMAFRVEELRS